MATRKETQVWLDQFPEDAVIEVITTHESRGGWDSYISVYRETLDLTEKVDPEFSTFAKTFEVEREYNPKGGFGKVILIRLGVKN